MSDPEIAIIPTLLQDAQEAAAILTNCAQILDVVKPEWKESWSEWDQATRDGITNWLTNHYTHAAKAVSSFNEETLGSTGPLTADNEFVKQQSQAREQCETILSGNKHCQDIKGHKGSHWGAAPAMTYSEAELNPWRPWSGYGKKAIAPLNAQAEIAKRDQYWRQQAVETAVAEVGHTNDEIAKALAGMREA